MHSENYSLELGYLTAQLHKNKKADGNELHPALAPSQFSAPSRAPPTAAPGNGRPCGDKVMG